MSEQPFDHSVTENLKTLKSDKQIILERIQKMEDQRDAVSEKVFQNVYNDYQHRLKEIEEKAEPLKNEIRREYAKLRTLMGTYEKELSTITLEKEELVFRHTLGEFEEGVYETHLKEIDTRLEEKKYSIEEIIDVKKGFLEVFDSEEDLETTPAANEEEPVEETPEEESVEEEVVEEEMVDEEIAEEEPVEETAEEVPPAELEEEQSAPEIEELPEQEFQEADLDNDEYADLLDEVPATSNQTPPSLDDSQLDTSIEDLESEVPELQPTDDFDGIEAELAETDLLDADDLTPPFPGDAHSTLPGQAFDRILDGDSMVPPPPPLPEGLDEPATVRIDKSQLNWDAGESEAEGTMIISNPKIVAIVDGKEGQVFSLGMGTTTLGRSPENDIHIPEERISRKHAQISFGPGGYSLYDMNSENGSYVNGTRIKEQILTDGDVILIGTTQFVYKEK